MSVATGTLRLGTRRSALARAQSAAVAAEVQRVAGRAVELRAVTTAGDLADGPVSALGGTGVFVGALRTRLLAGEIDLAVHSYKDLPTAPEPGLTVAAVPAREAPWDVLVSAAGCPLAELPSGARVGTGSPRRSAQLRLARPDLAVVPIRGNVDTRLAAVRTGELDAVVLARAGLARLGRLAEVTEVLDPAVMLPAPAQGALAVECRAGDPLLTGLLAALDDPPSRAAVTAERAVLAGVEAGCTAPLGALAHPVGDTDPRLHLQAVLVSADGTAVLRRSATGSAADAAELGRGLAADLLAAGAGSLLEER